jgi:hypothetical protein
MGGDTTPAIAAKRSMPSGISQVFCVCDIGISLRFLRDVSRAMGSSGRRPLRRVVDRLVKIPCWTRARVWILSRDPGDRWR